MTGDTVAKVAWLCVAFTYQLHVMLSAVEAVYAYVAIGSYRRHYHVGIRLPDDETAPPDHDVHELGVAVALIASAVSANVLAVMAAQSGWESFVSKQIPFEAAALPEFIFQSVYFVSTTMFTIGYGDIVPRNYCGQAVAMLMHMQSLLLIVGLFSSMLGYGLRRERALREDFGPPAQSGPCGNGDPVDDETGHRAGDATASK